MNSLEAQGPLVQYGRKTKVDNGPRAVGLVQLPEKGKPRLIPIAIMVDGKFYDADSYKAAPVPMAVDFGIVYEAFHGGVSQGVFTITQPGQLDKTWIAEGKWLPASMRAAAEKKKKFTPPVVEDENGPPVLHRHNPAGSESKESGKEKNNNADQDKNNDSDKDKNKDTEKDQSAKDAKASSDDAKASASTEKASAEAKQKADTKSPAETTKSSGPGASAQESDGDPNRPRLRRGAPPDPSVRRDVYAKFDPLPAPVVKPVAADQKISGVPEVPPVTTYPAVSAVGGPDPMPYIYDVKPSEEETYRAKMLDLAGTQMRAQQSGREAGRGAGNETGKENRTKETPKKAASGKTTPKSSKMPKVEFDDVSLRFFDLSNSNEPVLILSAKARVLAVGSTDTVEPKEITLIARTNLEGEVKKLFFSQTDSRHLDQTPRMEIVDAVDADGDGRGELLFRRVYDNGSAYGIYRVTSDRLWPLFEGTP